MKKLNNKKIMNEDNVQLNEAQVSGKRVVIYKLKQISDSFMVEEFERGISRLMSIEDYVTLTEGDLEVLLQDYLQSHESYSDQLHLQPAGGNSLKITDGAFDWAQISIPDVKNSISNGEDYLGIISYKTLFDRGLDYEGTTTPNDSEGKKAITDVLIKDFKESGLRAFINKHQFVSIGVFCIFLGISFIFALSKVASEPEYKLKGKDFNDICLDVNKNLKEVASIYKIEPRKAAMLLNTMLNKLNSISESKEISENDKQILENLIEKSNNYKELIIAKKED